MPSRKDFLSNNNYYHIYSRSIAKYIVFNDNDDFGRFLELLDLCRHKNFSYKFSKFMELELLTRQSIIQSLEKENLHLVDIVAYCIMPTHVHLLLKQISDDGISKFMLRLMSSYSRYFNFKHHRNGPLWTGRFKDVIVTTDEQLLHLTRYIHLNPTSAGLVENSADWLFSSFNEYIESDKTRKLCNFDSIVNMDPKEYKKFVLDQKLYQRQLAMIKNIIIDDYSG